MTWPHLNMPPHQPIASLLHEWRCREHPEAIQTCFCGEPEARHFCVMCDGPPWGEATT